MPSLTSIRLRRTKTSQFPLPHLVSPALAGVAKLQVNYSASVKQHVS
ncbi:hypothetical protein [Streptomyces peucetius]